MSAVQRGKLIKRTLTAIVLLPFFFFTIARLASAGRLPSPPTLPYSLSSSFFSFPVVYQRVRIVVFEQFLPSR